LAAKGKYYGNYASNFKECAAIHGAQHSHQPEVWQGNPKLIWGRSVGLLLGPFQRVFGQVVIGSATFQPFFQEGTGTHSKTHKNRRKDDVTP
jgi:hypothetical protein